MFLHLLRRLGRFDVPSFGSTGEFELRSGFGSGGLALTHLLASRPLAGSFLGHCGESPLRSIPGCRSSAIEPATQARENYYQVVTARYREPTTGCATAAAAAAAARTAVRAAAAAAAAAVRATAGTLSLVSGIT